MNSSNSLTLPMFSFRFFCPCECWQNISNSSGYCTIKIQDGTLHGPSASLLLSLQYPPSSHQAITITLHFQTSSKDTLLPVSLSRHLASIHQRALLLFIQTLELYKSFTYLLTYLHARYRQLDIWLVLVFCVKQIICNLIHLILRMSNAA